MVLYFNRSTCEKGGGASVVFITPHSFKFNFICTNNNTKYEALILTIKIIVKLKLKKG